MLIRLELNGESRQAEVEPWLLLVDFIRKELGLTGTKKSASLSDALPLKREIVGRSALFGGPSGLTREGGLRIIRGRVELSVGSPPKNKFLSFVKARGAGSMIESAHGALTARDLSETGRK